MRCSFCNETIAKGLKCKGCGRWNIAAGKLKTKTYLMSEITSDPIERVSTGPWDEAFSRGLAKTGVYLLGGAPGAGKTTLLLQIADKFPGEPLYVATEQSKEELRETWVRLECTKDIRIVPFLEGEGSLEGILEEYDPTLLVLDSINGLCGQNAAAQIEVCELVKRYAVKKKCPVIVIVHITKDDMMAGNMTIQHMGDATAMLYVSGEEVILTTIKNRFGPKFVEVAFTMGPLGLVPLLQKTPED